MSTGLGDRRWEGSAASLFLSLVLCLCLGLTACSPIADEAPAPAEPTLLETADADVAALLARRAAAVHEGDLTAFLADVDPAMPDFRERQQRYFLNLRELPLQVFAYTPEPGLTALDDGRVQAVVQVDLQLREYDAVPVRTPTLMTFRHGDAGWVLVEDRDAEFEADNDIEAQPWDLTRIEVRTGKGVLGIFDDRSINAAFHIVRAIEDGIARVSPEVPLTWSRKVVVYALSDLDVLASIDDLPGGDPDRLDGVAFPVRASATSPELAGTRFMLHPRMIDRNDGTRSRLIRHELTHVALGRRDDRVPTWLAEGLAEYVSVQPIPPYDRMISREALQAARKGVAAMPADGDFNGPHSGTNYGLAWFACQHIADAFGEKTLWRLFERMRAGDGTTEAEQDVILREVLGIDSAELARLSARKIVTTFG